MKAPPIWAQAIFVVVLVAIAFGFGQEAKLGEIKLSPRWFARDTECERTFSDSLLVDKYICHQQ